MKSRRRSFGAGALVLSLVVGLGVSKAGNARVLAAQITPELLARMASFPGAQTDIIVTFDDENSLQRVLPVIGPRPGIRLHAVPALAFSASAPEILDLASEEGVKRLQLDEQIPVLLSTATVASRAKAVWGSLDGGPITTSTGAVIDGAGVGVAVVDTGIDAGHPDLMDAVVKNFKVVGTSRLTGQALGDFLVEMQDTDTTGGHGTHVSGIVGGRGSASQGLAKGAAPGSGIYGFSVGEGINIIASHAAAAYDWIIANHASVTPPIRVVNNSWGGTGAFSSGDLIVQLQRQLVAAGVTVVWAAGNGDTLNDGGTCADDRVNARSKDPTPGVLSVANYDDADSGIRSGALDASSSRGFSSNASTWPDLAAPGTHIYSTLDRTGLATGWGDKALDIAFSAFEPGNPFGNAINQHEGTVRFRLGETTSDAATVEWIIFSKPIAVYNAHSNSFPTGSSQVAIPSASQLADVRFFGPVDAGPFDLPSASARPVSAGDALVLTKGSIGGTANPIKMQVTSPSGTSKTLTISFPCTSSCSVEVALSPFFGGEPADGTWTISPGPTPAPNRIMEALNPFYVNLTGTSMAAPHVAGVIALMIQANPSLTPAAVENLLEDTAFKFTAGAAYASSDTTNLDDTSSCDKGHGLVDAKGAVEAALAA